MNPEYIINPFGKSSTREFTVSSGSVIIVQEPGVNRIDAAIHITGTNCDVQMIILIAGHSSDNIIITTQQHHVSGGSRSSVLVKSIMDDSSHITYTGMIRVEKNANRTDAYQRNDNLLLSESARVVSEPVLEILSNDLRCTHGATTGPINTDQVWYLLSRGIDKKEISGMIARGFLLDGLKNIDSPAIHAVRQRLEIL